MERQEKVAQVTAAWEKRLKDIAGDIAEGMLNEEKELLGGTMDDLEGLAVAVGQGFGGEVLRTMLAHQAEQLDAAAACEECGRSFDKKSSRRRELTTRTGEVAWHEPVLYCRRCRRSFSPSVQTTAD